MHNLVAILIICLSKTYIEKGGKVIAKWDSQAVKISVRSMS